MEAIDTGDSPKPGLRERKKARTRVLIQEHALHLFSEQGYDETSVEQIAEAAEVSPSTVFRYFPTKPDLVIYDDLDARIIEAFRSQPPELNAVRALRAAFRTGFGTNAEEELELQRVRERLMRSVPELQAAMLGELARSVRDVAELVAERSGRGAGDDEVVALAGAVIGLAIAAWLGTEETELSTRYLDRIDAGMALVESGFRF